MTTVNLVETAGDDGLLRLAVPVAEAGKRYHVVIHLEPESALTSPTKTGWPPGFFEETAGKWEGDFPESSEGDYEERLPL